MLRTAETFFTLSIVTVLLGAYVFAGDREEVLEHLKEEE